MVPFGGWEMPLDYGSTVDEHRRCRSDAVVFDVSHLGTVRLDDDGALHRLQHALSNDLGKIGPGRAQYTHLLNDAGGVLDDLIVWWHADGTFDVMPNASNTDRVVAAVGGVDITPTRAVLAVQGPTAREQLATVNGDAARVGRYRVGTFEHGSPSGAIAGTGYTGEDGVELTVPADAATDLWDAVVDAGVHPAGLGARDTLRLEAGLPLHGNELGPEITPDEAGLGWVVALGKPSFVGRTALVDRRERGVARQLIGLAVDGRRPPRKGYAVVHDGRTVGEVTSGNFSPMLERGIALAFVPTDLGPDGGLAIDMRGTATPATRVELPFWRR